VVIGGGGNWAVFFLGFRRPRALSDIEENFDTRIARPPFGVWGRGVRVGGEESQEIWI